ncbi:hypothetical protein HELRODRAFT_86104, partial [Helobdella robusta]|uniref:Uncharacterized protein n=1 Tax=Helobdella robusta TaxID=6412 RepID=T1G674_HELRO
SRCSPATSGLARKLWLPCASNCKVCFKAGSGNCVKSPSKICPNLLKDNKQCVCMNKRAAKNTSIIACRALTVDKRFDSYR